MKIAIYGNIGPQKGQDTQEQLDRLRVFVRSKGHEVYLFVDRDSGRTSERPKLQQLLASAARREFQRVLVWALDRFIGETVAEAFENVQKLLRAGVQFESAAEKHVCTNGPAGDRMLTIAAWIAQQERIRISERTKAGLAAARRKAQRLGRPWRVFPHHFVAADRQHGMSWRQLEQKYGVGQSTLRNGLRNLGEADVPPNGAEPQAGNRIGTEVGAADRSAQPSQLPQRRDTQL